MEFIRKNIHDTVLQIFKQKFQFWPIIRIQMNLEYRDTDSTNFRMIEKKVPKVRMFKYWQKRINENPTCDFIPN